MNNSAVPAWGLYTDHPEPVSYAQVFSPAECEDIIKTCRHFEAHDGGVMAEGNVQQNIRNSKITFVPPVPEMVAVYQKITDVVFMLNDRNWNFDLFAFNEHLQYTEYVAPSGKYDSHTDTWYNGPIRKLSIIVQLTDETQYSGGDVEAIFSIERPQPLPRKQGMLIAFPSYVLHRVTPVTLGKRNSLVGWITGKPFK
jgi:PKHD-type hydroxylase